MSISSLLMRVGPDGVYNMTWLSMFIALFMLWGSTMKEGRVVKTVCFSVCAVAMLCAITGCIVVIDGMYTETERSFVTDEEYLLVNLVVNEKIHGDIMGGPFVVRAEISSGPIFRFYYRQDDGGYKLGDIPAGEATTTVYYSDDLPRIEVGRDETTAYKYWFGELVDVSVGPPYGKMEYRVYVPEGSIIEEYQLSPEAS